MESLEKHLSLCFKETKKIHDNLFVGINQDNELNLYWGGAYLNLSLYAVISINEDYVAIILNDTKVIGFYKNGVLLKEFNFDGNGYNYVFQILLEHLICNEIETPTKAKVRFNVAIYDKLGNSIHIAHAFTISSRRMTVKEIPITIYKSVSNIQSTDSDFAYIHVHNKLSTMYAKIPSFVLEKGYFYDYSYGHLEVANIVTGATYSYNTFGHYLCNSAQSYSYEYDFEEYYALSFQPNNLNIKYKCNGFTALLPRDNSPVKFYNGLLSYKTRLLCYNDTVNNYVTISTLYGSVVAHGIFYSCYNNTCISFDDYLFDVISGCLYSKCVQGLELYVLQCPSAEILETGLKAKTFYYNTGGILNKGTLESLYSNVEKDYDGLTEVLIAKCKLNGLYLITDSEGVPLCDTSFDTSYAALSYLESDTRPPLNLSNSTKH